MSDEPRRLSTDDIAQYERDTIELAKPTNPGHFTAFEMFCGRIKKLPSTEMTRRVFFGGITFIIGVGGQKAADHFLTDPRTGAGLVDDMIGQSIEPSVIEYIRQSRSGKQGLLQFEQYHPAAEQLSKFVVGLIQRFDKGHTAPIDDIKRLHNIIGISTESATKQLVREHLIEQYNRLGVSSLARSVVDNIDLGKAPPKTIAGLVEKRLSTRYLTVKKSDFLKPALWGFDQDIEYFKQTVGSASQIEIAFEEGNFRVRGSLDRIGRNAPPLFQEFGVSGFYALFWMLHAVTASAPPQEIKDLANHQLHMFRSFRDAATASERAIWNSLFIGAIQLHRLGQSELRDKFFLASLGGDRNLNWSKPINDVIDERLRNLEVVPICWLLFARTTPELWRLLGAKQSHYNRILKFISADRGQINSQRLRAAVDQVRKIDGEEATAPQARRDYGFGDGSQDIYLPKFTSIRRALSSD